MSEHTSGMGDFYARGLARFSISVLPLTAVSAVATSALILLEFWLLHSSQWPVAVIGACIALLHAAVAVVIGNAALVAVRDLRRGMLGLPPRVLTHAWWAASLRRADARATRRSWRLVDFLAVATPFYPVALFAMGSMYGLFWSEAVQQLELRRSSGRRPSACADDAEEWLSTAPSADLVRTSRRVLSATASRSFDLAEVG